MPGSPTTPGWPSARVGALGHVAFHYTDSVGTRDHFSIAAQLLACTFPCRRFADILADACDGLGPMWVATPSSRWTCTTYSLPVSRRTRMKRRSPPTIGQFTAVVWAAVLRRLRMHYSKRNRITGFPQCGGLLHRLGHEEQFPLPRANGRCLFGERTFTRTHGNDRDAPIPDLPALVLGNEEVRSIKPFLASP